MTAIVKKQPFLPAPRCTDKNPRPCTATMACFSGLFPAPFPSLLAALFVAILPALAGTRVLHAADGAVPNFNGVWVTVLVSFDDPRWKIADLVCARTGCSVEGYAYLQTLLADPANKNRTSKQLVADMEQFQVKSNEKLLTPEARRRQAEFDPTKEASLDCTPDGDDLRHQVTAPLPMQIEQHDDKVILRYEYWNAVRTVYLNQDSHPEGGEPSRLGHSIGHYEGNTLVVETAQMIASETGIPNGTPLMLSADAKAVERYTLAEDGQSLDMVMDIIDPAIFNGPLQLHRRMLIEPDWELEEFVCESITGEF